MKKVEIKWEEITVPKEIKVDGKIYPNHKQNWNVLEEYLETKDESILDRLLDVSLEFQKN